MGVFDNLLGGGVNANVELLTKKDYQYQNESSQVDVNIDSRSNVFSPQSSTDYTLIFNSPSANVTKKESLMSSPQVTQSPVIDVPTTQGQTQEGGSDSLIGGSSGTLLILGGVAVAGVIAYSYLGNKKKSDKK